MEETLSTLLDRWLATPDVLVLDEASVAVARDRVREVGRGFASNAMIETMALLASELLMNQLRHASGGRFAVHRIERDGVAGLEVVAADRGPGLADPAGAITGSPAGSRGGSLGAGVGAVFRLADEVDVDVRVGEGTCFRARKLATSPRHRAEVGIYGRPCPGESVSGDDAGFSRTEPGGDVTSMVVADGAGHGMHAREAAARAVRMISATDDPAEIVRKAERTLVVGRQTRRAAMAVIRADAHTGVLRCAASGDVVVRVVRAVRAGADGPTGCSGTGGRDDRSVCVVVDEDIIAAGDTIVVATDGVSSQGALSALRTSSRSPHPILLAHAIVSASAREHDDALVVVARMGSPAPPTPARAT